MIQNNGLLDARTCSSLKYSKMIWPQTSLRVLPMLCKLRLICPLES